MQHADDKVASQKHGRNNKAERHQEIEDFLNNRLYHPLAYQLALKLSTTRITPNLVSIAGGSLVILAAYIYTLPHWPFSIILALFLHMSWHIVDGADGDLARLTGNAGPMGEIIDGLSDYGSHIILYCMMALLLSTEIGPFMAWAAAIGAGASRILQANHYEVCRRQYQWWAYGKSWLGRKPLLPTNIWGRIAEALSNIYLAGAKQNYAHSEPINMLILQAEKSEKGRNLITKALHNNLLPHLKSISLLSANYRTIVLGGAMLSGSPLWFFLYEILLLNVVFIRSLIHHKRAMQHFENTISAHSLA